MKILLANKFYYRRGGDCIYTMNLEKMLKEKGHEVAVYAMQYPENKIGFVSPERRYELYLENRCILTIINIKY